MRSETAKYALKVLMSNISEETWRAGWYSRLEFILWARVLDYRNRKDTIEWDGLLVMETHTLIDLSEAAGGWLYWDRGIDEVCFAPLVEWEAMYARQVAK